MKILTTGTFTSVEAENAQESIDLFLHYSVKAEQKIPETKGRGRPSKYETPEQRKAARAAYARAWYRGRKKAEEGTPILITRNEI